MRVDRHRNIADELEAELMTELELYQRQDWWWCAQSVR